MKVLKISDKERMMKIQYGKTNVRISTNSNQNETYPMWSNIGSAVICLMVMDQIYIGYPSGSIFIDLGLYIDLFITWVYRSLYYCQISLMHAKWVMNQSRRVLWVINRMQRNVRNGKT